jgi:hypothetical protein
MWKVSYFRVSHIETLRLVWHTYEYKCWYRAGVGHGNDCREGCLLSLENKRLIVEVH